MVLGFVPPRECTCGLPPWLSTHVASAQLFEGLSPKIFREEVNNEKKTKFNERKKEGRSPVAAGSERLRWSGRLANGCSLHHRAEI